MLHRPLNRRSHRTRRPLAACWVTSALLVLALWAMPVQAHTFRITEADLILPGDGTFRVELLCDLDALALGVSPETDDAELSGRLAALSPRELEAELSGLVEFFERRARVRFDGASVPFAVAFPERRDRPGGDPPSLLGTVARLEGAIPADAETVSLFLSRSFPPLRLQVVRPAGLGEAEDPIVLTKGEESPEIPLAGPAPAAGPVTVFWRYVVLGFEHILPAGLDHVLFILGLYLLAARWRPLIAQVTVFTLAHSLTLALAIFGVVNLPSRPVEILIALSIAAVGLENLWAKEASRWRLLVVFLFGLLHGLGFAGVLGELGLPVGERVLGLVAFNVGVELGQIAVLGLAFACVGWARDKPWYRKRIVMPLSLLVAAVGLYWAAERMLG